jgi:nucleotide-binding universal stress UspA family protein
MQLQVREGGDAKVFLDACEGAVMLVVRSRSYGARRLLLGSVRASGAEHASCPAFIVHRNQAPHPGKPRVTRKPLATNATRV